MLLCRSFGEGGKMDISNSHIHSTKLKVVFDTALLSPREIKLACQDSGNHLKISLAGTNTTTTAALMVMPYDFT